MAVVYRATDLRHDALVAIKVLHPDFASRVGAERFTREVQIAARLQHPNVVPVFDSGVHEGLPFYVMPYVEGETLEGRMAREGPLPIDEAVRIAGEVADALEEAHAQGFVHRDVKPGNILLSHGHAMLSDFGIARALEAVGSATLTEAGLVPGTAAYMSPEQALGQEVDGRSDLYSLCCVLYEMLTGGPPFTGSPQVLRARHSAEAAPGLRTARETIPAALERVVLKGLSKLPADRFADARSLRDALEHASRSTAPPRRTRPLVIAGALGLLAIVTAVWLARDRAGRDDALDVNRIIVFPLVVSADFAGDRTVGEDMATLIGSTLKMVPAETRCRPLTRMSVTVKRSARTGMG